MEIQSRLLAVTCIAAVAVVLALVGYCASALYWHGPTSFDLAKFDWDGMAAAMSFVGAATTVGAIAAALYISRADLRHRAAQEQQAARAFSMLAINELFVLITAVGKARRVIREIAIGQATPGDILAVKTIVESAGLPLTVSAIEKIALIDGKVAWSIARVVTTLAHFNQILAVSNTQQVRQSSAYSADILIRGHHRTAVEVQASANHVFDSLFEMYGYGVKPSFRDAELTDDEIAQFRASASGRQPASE